jgi:hypothetical protein
LYPRFLDFHLRTKVYLRSSSQMGELIGKVKLFVQILGTSLVYCKYTKILPASTSQWTSSTSIGSSQERIA